MKGIFFASIVAFTTLVVLSCNDSNDNTLKKSDSSDTTGLGAETQFAASGPMDPGLAKELIKKFKSSKLKKGDLAYTNFDTSVLNKVFREGAEKNMVGVRFFCAGFVKIMGGNFELVPLVIMQVQYGSQDTTAVTQTYTYEYYSGVPHLCPPPDPCSIDVESINN